MSKKITFNNKVKQTVLLQDCIKSTGITYTKFMELHTIFMQDKELEGLAPRTLQEHIINLGYFNKYINSKQSNTNCSVDTDLIKSYIYHMLQEEEYSKYTVNIRLRTLKCYLKWLYDNKYISENINMKIKLVKVPIDQTQPLQDSDIRKILKQCDTSTYVGYRDFTAIILILDCGIRIGEMVQLQISDIDLKEGLITVRAEVSKTRCSRQLPISIKTCKLLKELIDCAKQNNCNYIFQSLYGNQIKKQNLVESFSKLGKKSGIDKKFTPYVLRHTFATNVVKNDSMDLFTLQKIMGHNSLITTRKYIQLDTQDLKKKHKKASPINKFLK